MHYILRYKIFEVLDTMYYNVVVLETVPTILTSYLTTMKDS